VILARDVLNGGPTRALFETGRDVSQIGLPEPVADSL
jgi:hypothetical protein